MKRYCTELPCLLLHAGPLCFSIHHLLPVILHVTYSQGQLSNAKFQRSGKLRVAHIQKSQIHVCLRSIYSFRCLTVTITNAKWPMSDIADYCDAISRKTFANSFLFASSFFRISETQALCNKVQHRVRTSLPLLPAKWK